ncbi:hypothetical protein [Luteimonas aquatica]|uniref:hypothetical protein n=1 Tax=Luteimonas aquatica TaxID=450364 RepID=UPI001F5A4C11|nr:hypothetical protein [Luteimonas aquatica]
MYAAARQSPSAAAQALASNASASTSPAWLDDDTLRAVRPQVRQLLEASPGFRELPVAEQQELARNMVRVASYMANPDGLAKQELTPGQGLLRKDAPAAQALGGEGGAPAARALADPVDQAKGKASEKIGTFAGSDFTAGSVQQGATNFKNFVGAVDFPAFVGGLIKNVFQAIVESSIQQMQAYAEMLKSVAQTVDQFASDNISLNNARDYVMDKYPGQFSLDTSNAGSEGGMPRLVPSGDDPDGVLSQINAEFGLAEPLTDVSDEEQETRLVMAARLQMARSRQQLLASMVMLGISRIVVTDGLINAKVVFDFQASDQAKRDAGASLYDSQSSSNRNRTRASAGIGWFGGMSTDNVNTQAHRTVVSSSVNETSESKQEMKAKLTGEVRVNFKSDYLPLEKMASPGMIASIQGNATPYDPNTPSGRGGAAAGAAA